MSEEKKIFDKKFVYLEWDDELKGKKVFVGDTLPQLMVSVNGHCDSLQEVSNNISDDSFYPFISSCGNWHAMVYYDPNYECKVAYYTHGKTIQCRNKGEDKWIITSNPSWLDRCEYRVKPEMWTACIDNEGIVSVMPARDWNKDAGRELINGTRNECKDYAIGRYCMNCIHRVSSCCVPTLACQGFSEPREPKKKRRKTNRELAQWIAQGNGQVKHRDGKYAHNTFNAYDIHDDNKPCPDYLVIRGWDETEWHEPEVEEWKND